MSSHRGAESARPAEPARGPVGRPPASKSAMLAAARALFTSADSPHSVTMDAVAVAAGVGKGTVFRAFGDRDGLLDELVAAEFAPLRRAVNDGEAPFAEGDAATERIAAFLDAVLGFKLANRNLMRAREIASTTNNLASDRYRWMHEVLAGWVRQAGSAMSPSFVAHALLLPLQIDVLEQLVAEGTSVEELRRQQQRYQAALLQVR